MNTICDRCFFIVPKDKLCANCSEPLSKYTRNERKIRLRLIREAQEIKRLAKLIPHTNKKACPICKKEFKIKGNKKYCSWFCRYYQGYLYPQLQYTKK